LLFIEEIPHPAEFTLSPKGERAGIRDDSVTGTYSMHDFH